MKVMELLVVVLEFQVTEFTYVASCPLINLR